MKFFKSIFLIFLSFGFVVNSFPDNTVRRQLGLFDEIEDEISNIRGEIGYVRGNLSVLNETVYDHYTELLEDIELNYNNINENYESIKDNTIAIGVNENNYEIVSTDVQTNVESIRTNSESIQTNTQYILKNSYSIGNNSESIQNISNYIYDLNMFSTENEININNMGILVDDNTNSILELTNSLSIYDNYFTTIFSDLEDKTITITILQNSIDELQSSLNTLLERFEEHIFTTTTTTTTTTTATTTTTTTTTTTEAPAPSPSQLPSSSSWSLSSSDSSLSSSWSLSSSDSSFEINDISDSSDILDTYILVNSTDNSTIEILTNGNKQENEEMTTHFNYVYLLIPVVIVLFMGLMVAFVIHRRNEKEKKKIQARHSSFAKASITNQSTVTI